MTVQECMHRWRPGSYDWNWTQEADFIMREHPNQFLALAESIEKHGLREAIDKEDPICLGDDGRVWEGHHRLVAASKVDKTLELPSDVIHGRTVLG